MTPTLVPFADGQARLDWLELTEALAAGHGLPRAEISDTFLYRGPDTMLSRAAWIDGMGLLVKTATIFPGNAARGDAAINGSVSLFSDREGVLEAVIDFHLVTKWKTAGDSLLAALRLARPESRRILIVGAGTVAGTLVEAFRAGFPEAAQTLWNRTESRARELADRLGDVDVATDLESAVRAADIIVSATMSTEPVIKGAWLQPGQHVNLIGAYRPDMREVDDDALARARIYTDSYDTTLEHIGEFRIPLQSGALMREDVLADYYDLASFRRGTSDDITLFKNGGGAHLDLMTSRYILERWQDS